MYEYLLFMPLIPILASGIKFHEVKVRSGSFYSHDKVRTKSMNNCANICMAQVRNGGNYSAFVYDPEEEACSPTNFGPYDLDTAGLDESDVMAGFQADTSEILAQSFYLYPGRCSSANPVVLGLTGACVSSTLDPHVPPLPNEVKFLYENSVAFANGVLLTCGGYSKSSGSCTDYSDPTTNCWFLDMKRRETDWAWNGTAKLETATHSYSMVAVGSKIFMAKSWGAVTEVFDTETNTLGPFRRPDGSLAPRLIYAPPGKCLVSIGDDAFLNINSDVSTIVNVTDMTFTDTPKRPVSFGTVVCGRVVLNDRSLVMVRDKGQSEEIFFLDTSEPRAGWFQMPDISAKDVASAGADLRQELVQLKLNGDVLFFDGVGQNYQILHPNNGSWTVRASPDFIPPSLSVRGTAVDAKFFLNSRCSLV